MVYVQELLLACPKLQQHPEWLVAAMTHLFVNAEAMLSLNCVLYDQASFLSAQEESGCTTTSRYSRHNAGNAVD